MKNISIIATAAFLVYASVVNLNDPDAWFWSTAYGVGALLTLLLLIRSDNVFLFIARQVSLVGSGVFLVFSLYLIVAHSKSTFRQSGKSGWLGIMESELMREGCGSLLLALSLFRSSGMMNIRRQRCEKKNSSYEHMSCAGKMLWSSVTIVAFTGIGLGLFLPWYYNRLGGITIPAHCGGGA